jgi:curli production assembly/transport component CsgF
MKKTLLTIATLILVANNSNAELVHQFRSPSFNGIGYSSHVQTIENTERTRRDAESAKILQAAKDAAAEAKNTNLQKFLNNFESRVYAQLSSQLVNSLFGENPQNTGTVQLEGNKITYSKSDAEINLTVVGQDGSVTEINIPVGQFNF